MIILTREVTEPLNNNKLNKQLNSNNKLITTNKLTWSQKPVQYPRIIDIQYNESSLLLGQIIFMPVFIS